MHKLLHLLALMVTSVTFADPVLQRAAAHQAIGDFSSAVTLLQNAHCEEPASEPYAAALIRALALEGAEESAVTAYQSYRTNFGDQDNLMEAVAWGILRKGGGSSSLMTRYTALLAATLTRDVEAVALLEEALQSQSSLLRSAAVELSTRMRDTKLRREVARLLEEDPTWSVQIEAIRAAGQMQMKELQGRLEEIIASDKALPEGKLAAIASLLEMVDEASHEELLVLATHPRAGLRQLAAVAIAEFELEGEVELLIPLLSDSHPQVRLMALDALGLLRAEVVGGRSVVGLIRPLLDDREQTVAITAAWLLTLIRPEEGRDRLAQWFWKDHETARFAAAALRATGGYGLPLARNVILSHPDPYVRATVAMGLIEQRTDTERAAETLFAFFTQNKERWMWDKERNPLFNVLQPSTIRYTSRVPNFPEVVNQLTRLDVVGLLAVVDHPHAQAALRTFLKERSWGVSGLAAVTLLEEGNESALDLVRSLLNDPDRSIRVQAALGIAIWGKDPSAVTVLQEAYPIADRELKIKILESLGHIGSKESIPFLVETLDEPFQTLRIIAASSLIQCING